MKFGQSKKEEPKQLEHIDYENSSVSVEPEPEDLNSTAFSLIKGPESGFSLVTLKFNPITMQAKVVDVKKVADSREEGEYHFRVEVGAYFASQEAKS